MNSIIIHRSATGKRVKVAFETTACTSSALLKEETKPQKSQIYAATTNTAKVKAERERPGTQRKEGLVAT